MIKNRAVFEITQFLHSMTFNGPSMDQLEHAPSDLMRALDAIERCQIRFLEDLQSTCKGDPCFLEAFRRLE